MQARLRDYMSRRLDSTTQKDLAKELGVAQSYLSSLMSGKAGGGGKILKAIANADPDAFIGIVGYDADEVRYSNREEAIRFLIRDGHKESDVREAANRVAVALDADEDPSAYEWASMIRPFIKGARRGTVPGLDAREITDEEG